MPQHYFCRTCQECGHIQSAQEPKGEMSNAYRASACRLCKSTSMDYGHSGFVKEGGKYKLAPLTDDEEW